MGLQLKISASEQKNSFIVYDCTKNYKFDNLGGWGTINPEIKNITSAIIYVTPPNLPKGSDPYAVDVTGNFPNENGLGMEILPNQVGQVNNRLESGPYKIKLEVIGTDRKGLKFKKDATLLEIFINDVTCCVDGLQKFVNRDAHKDKKQQAAIELNNLLESANHAISCDLVEQATEIIEILKSQCVCIDC